MSLRTALVLPVLLAFAATGCGEATRRDEVLVFAAASLADVAPRLGELYRSDSGVSVRFAFGSSAALARQVAAGAPAELLLSADGGQAPPDRSGPSVPFAGNELVLIAGVAGDWPPGGLLEAESLAVGDWRAGVPVGLRARDWLESGDLLGPAGAGRAGWTALADRLLPCVDARATLAAVLSGSAQAGIVYSTDAASTARVRVLRRGGPRVVYRAVETASTGEAARDFLRFLGSPPAQELLRRQGFSSEAGAPAGAGS